MPSSPRPRGARPRDHAESSSSRVLQPEGTSPARGPPVRNAHSDPKLTRSSSSSRLLVASSMALAGGVTRSFPEHQTIWWAPGGSLCGGKVQPPIDPPSSARVHPARSTSWSVTLTSSIQSEALPSSSRSVRELSETTSLMTTSPGVPGRLEPLRARPAAAARVGTRRGIMGNSTCDNRGQCRSPRPPRSPGKGEATGAHP